MAAAIATPRAVTESLSMISEKSMSKHCRENAGPQPQSAVLWRAQLRVHGVRGARFGLWAAPRAP